MRLYRSDAGWQEHEKDIRAVIVSMSPPSYLRYGCIAAEPAAVSPGKIIVPRIVIGGVIIEQPAGGGIGAALAWGLEFAVACGVIFGRDHHAASNRDMCCMLLQQR